MTKSTINDEAFGFVSEFFPVVNFFHHSLSMLSAYMSVITNPKADQWEELIQRLSSVK